MIPERAKATARHLWLPMALGSLVALVLFGVFLVWQEAQSPTELDGNRATEKLSDLPPFIDGEWIKVPFDRARSRECLTQSTFALIRQSNYPAPLGRREDDVILALRNNPISGLGQASKLLWFKRPDVPQGEWTVTVEAGRDCGSWLHPGTKESGPIPLGQVRLPPSL